MSDKKNYILKNGVTYEELYELAVSRAQEVSKLQKQVAEMRVDIFVTRSLLRATPPFVRVALDNLDQMISKLTGQEDKK